MICENTDMLKKAMDGVLAVRRAGRQDRWMKNGSGRR